MGGWATDTDKVLTLGQDETVMNPAQRRIRTAAIAAAVVLHVIVLAMLVYVPRHKPVRLSVAHEGGISAFVNVAPTPTGTTGARPTPTPRPVTKAPAVVTPTQMPASIAEAPASEQGSGGAQGGAPVRMSIGQLQLIKKVEPIYPALMLAAKQQGIVVLDAIIHPDGSIGDIRVLQPLSPLFDRAAIAAVKQWQYTPLPYEGVVTVTVKFTLR
jgi:TonB family protein